MFSSGRVSVELMMNVNQNGQIADLIETGKRQNNFAVALLRKYVKSSR